MSDSVPAKRVSGVPQVPLEFFFTSMLPSLFDMAPQVEKFLSEDGHIVEGRWTHLSSSSPCGSNTTGSDSLNDLIQIFDTIVEVAGSVRKQPPNACFIASVPTGATPASCDAQIRLVTPEIDSESRFSTAVPWRLDTMRKPRESNNRGLIWSCQDVLRDDPCRRFTYGVTLEDGHLRIWFFSRSDELVSSPFAITAVSPFIQLFLCLAFATPEQLGYDTTISHCIDDAGGPQLKITLGSTVYVTKRLLSDHRADAVCGRATRVWEAYREHDADRCSVAVKDLWTSVDTVQEGVQLSELREKLRNLIDPGTPYPEQYFLTVLDHGYVQTSDGMDDHTLDIMTRGSFPPTGSAHYPRKHYRIVFQDVGVPVHRLHSMSEVLRALADSTRALQLLYRLGLVHRDVSAGNILFVDGIGKLSDLEYLKSFMGPASPPSDEPLIGTAAYTSGEAAARTYGFIPDTGEIIGPHPPPFRFNPLHDLESTMWIGFWTLLYHRRDDRTMKAIHDKYFPPEFTSVTVNDRMVAMSHGFKPVNQSDPLFPAMHILHSLRRALYKRYTAFEGDFSNQYLFFDGATPSNGSAFDGIHSTFIAEYEKAALASEDIPLWSSERVKRKISCGDANRVSPE
ncbi:hypothetical protein C8R43DRAFT_1020812, partial [Mycena crocata]